MFLLGVFGMVFLLGKVKHCHVPCRFCGGDDHDGHLFWECTFPLLVEIRENPEFHELMEMDKSFWLRCLLWHGWLPLLSGANLGSPWAQDLSQGAGHLLESALGSYSAAPLLDWRLPVGFDAGVAALQVAQEPDVWTDGSRTEDRLSTVSSSGAGFSTGLSSRFWAGCTWGHVDSDVQGNLAVASCRGYCSVPGPLQTVQRAELWGVILALQVSRGVHLGVDNLNVVRHVGRMLDNDLGSLPFQVLPDGDLLCLIHRMLMLRGLDTVKVTKVKGHASEDMVVDGRVRDLDRLGNMAADAADFGRRRVPVRVIDARRNLVGVCNRWYPVSCSWSASFFFVAIARAVVNHDDGGGTAPHPLVWSAGSLPKRRRDVDAVRNFAFLPGPACFWSGEWVSFGVSGITVDDVGVWPYSVSLLVKVSAFLGTLHWPVAADDLGVGSVSFVELLILYELWAGEWLSLEKAVPKRRRAGRPISVSAVPFGPGIDIWRSCRFFVAIFRALSLLPGGLGRFLPGRIGANHGRLRHIGWEKCCHGLTSRPRETSSVWFLDELLILFGYPVASGADLLAGTLPLRYYSDSFARRIPTWSLPENGNVASFLASWGLVWGGHSALSSALGRAGVSLGSGSGGGAKRIRLYRKTPAHLARQGVPGGTVSSQSLEEASGFSGF